MRKVETIFFIITGALLVISLGLLGDPTIIAIFLIYLVFHAACFVAGWKFNGVWLRFIPSGLIVAGMLTYLLHGAINVLRGHVLTALFAVFLLGMVFALVFSITLSRLLERVVSKKSRSDHLLNDRD